MTTEPAVTVPVALAKVVACPPHAAFDAWTARLGDWWPPNRTLGGDRVAAITLEGRIGGRLFERWHDGSEHTWATVTAWEPPVRLALAWARDDAAGTEVVVAFRAAGPATTTVTIEHRGFEHLLDGDAVRSSYAGGPTGWWNPALAAFADAVVDPGVHRYFGVRSNNEAWQRFETPDEVAALLAAVHTSAWHWRQIGAPENLVRADWMCSHAYALLGEARLALRYAEASWRRCDEHGIGDFDLAYAYEALARAAAAAGDRAGAARHLDAARRAGAAIADTEDRAMFEGDLAAEPWYGVTA